MNELLLEPKKVKTLKTTPMHQEKLFKDNRLIVRNNIYILFNN